jgi:hypothetical protein
MQVAIVIQSVYDAAKYRLNGPSHHRSLSCLNQNYSATLQFWSRWQKKGSDLRCGGGEAALRDPTGRHGLPKEEVVFRTTPPEHSLPASSLRLTSGGASRILRNAHRRSMRRVDGSRSDKLVAARRTSSFMLTGGAPKP